MDVANWFHFRTEKKMAKYLFLFLFAVPCYLCFYCVFWKAGQKLQINCGNVTMRPCFFFLIVVIGVFCSSLSEISPPQVPYATHPHPHPSQHRLRLIGLGLWRFTPRPLRPERPDEFRLSISSASRWQQGEGKIFCLIPFIYFQLISLSLSFWQMPPSRPADRWLGGPVDLLLSSQFDLICLDLNAPVGFSKYARSVRQQPFSFICFRKAMVRNCVHHLRVRQRLIWKGSN